MTLEHACQIWTDARFEAVPEARRVELFRKYRDVLKQAAAWERRQQAAAQAQQPAPQVEAVHQWIIFGLPVRVLGLAKTAKPLFLSSDFSSVLGHFWHHLQTPAN